MLIQQLRNNNRRQSSLDYLQVGVIVVLLVIIALVWKINLEVVSQFEQDQLHNKYNRFDVVLLQPPPAPQRASVKQRNHDRTETMHKNGRDENENSFPEDKVMPNPGPDEKAESTLPKFHIVFSTGCSIFQDWQSYTFFYFAMQSGQPGSVTRVASGCKADEAKALRKQFEVQIRSMSPRFNLHITPDYSGSVPGKTYKFFNKPMGLRHWMENELGFPNTSDYNNTIFVIMDPDQIILRPFQEDYAGEQEVYTRSALNYTKIAMGQPMAAEYGFGAAWSRQINISAILNSTEEPSPVRSWTSQIILQNYAVGPPYVAMGHDMYRIVKTWAQFVVPIYHQMGGAFLAEMFAYSVGACHENLPHRIVKSFMISDHTGSRAEPWREWVDNRTSVEVCSLDFQPMPHVFHFCQRYYLGPFFFGKYKVPKEEKDKFFSCEHPLFVEPPSNIGDLYNTSITPNHVEQILKPHERIRMAFALCQLIPRINQAALYFKQQHCPEGTANVEKTYYFPKDPIKGKQKKEK